MHAVQNAFSKAVTGVALYPASWQPLGRAWVVLGRDADRKYLFVLAARKAELPAAFTGVVQEGQDCCWQTCHLSHANALALRQAYPWAGAVSLRDRRSTLGCGDRLGRATPGHIRAVRGTQIVPVLAQQSIRELNLTGRTYEQVVDDVTFLVFQEGFRDGFGADGDHLKTLKDIDMAIDAGMTMITLDLSEVMTAAAQNWDAAQVETAYLALPQEVKGHLAATYLGKTFNAGLATIGFSELEAKRCAVMYVKALDFAREVYLHLRSRRGDAFDLEMSIDETSAPTLPAHHFFIIRELIRRGVTVTSLAPRFIGEFQKGIDYIGNLAEFEKQFAIHCEIARASGGYKISIHSGSDKFSVFPAIGKYTQHYVHVKTAGTSWLEAVRTLAVAEPALYRRIQAQALATFQDAKKYYHVTTDLAKIPPLTTVADSELPALMEHNEARQLLHITYGYILQDPAIRPLFFAALHRHEEAYYAALQKHFGRHLQALGIRS